MGKAATAGWAGLAMLAAGAALVLAATIRLTAVGLFDGGFLGLGELDFVSVSFWLLGAALVVGGVAMALVGLADRVLGALPSGTPSSSSSADLSQEARPTAVSRPVVSPPVEEARAAAVAPATATAPAVSTATLAPVGADDVVGAAPATSREPRADRARATWSRVQTVLATATASLATGLSRAARVTADALRRAARSVAAWVRRTTPLVVAWCSRSASAVAGRVRPAARATAVRTRRAAQVTAAATAVGARATASATVAGARATGASARRASSAAATRARDNARTVAASRQASRQHDLDRESALQSARVEFLASRRPSASPADASTGVPTVDEVAPTSVSANHTVPAETEHAAAR